MSGRPSRQHRLFLTSCLFHLLKPARLAAIFFCVFIRGSIFSYGQDELTTRALELTQAGKFHDAEVLWRRLEDQHPSSPTVHNGLAFSLLQQGQLDQAASEYGMSLALDPHQADIAFGLGVTEFKQGHFSQAVPAFQSFENLTSNDPAVFCCWG